MLYLAAFYSFCRVKLYAEGGWRNWIHVKGARFEGLGILSLLFEDEVVFFHQAITSGWHQDGYSEELSHLGRGERGVDWHENHHCVQAVPSVCFSTDWNAHLPTDLPVVSLQLLSLQFAPQATSTLIRVNLTTAFSSKTLHVHTIISKELCIHTETT